MPSVKQSRQVDMSAWEPAPAAAAANVMPLPDDSTSSKQPTMLASMPLAASTGDAFQRQFYGGANIPSFRILPAKRGGGA